MGKLRFLMLLKNWEKHKCEKCLIENVIISRKNIIAGAENISYFTFVVHLAHLQKARTPRTNRDLSCALNEPRRQTSHSSNNGGLPNDISLVVCSNIGTRTALFDRTERPGRPFRQWRRPWITKNHRTTNRSPPGFEVAVSSNDIMISFGTVQSDNGNSRELSFDTLKEETSTVQKCIASKKLDLFWCRRNEVSLAPLVPIMR